MIRIAQGLVISAALAACAGGPPHVPTPATSLAPRNITLAEAKKTILAERAKTWRDPYSIRDARIGEMNLCAEDRIGANGAVLRNEPGTCVCVELNARNAYGGYTGLQRTVFVFWDSGGHDARDGGTSGYQGFCRTTVPFSDLNGETGAKRKQR